MQHVIDGLARPLEPILSRRPQVVRLQTITGVSSAEAQAAILDGPDRSGAAQVLDIHDLVTAPERAAWLRAHPWWAAFDQAECVAGEHCWPWDVHFPVAQCLLCGAYVEALDPHSDAPGLTEIDAERYFHLLAAHRVFSAWAPPNHELAGLYTQQQWVAEHEHERDQLWIEAQLTGRPAWEFSEQASSF